MPGAEQKPSSPSGGSSGGRLFQKLYVLATVIALSSTGTIPLGTFAFAAFSLPYTLLLSKLAFPSPPASPPPPPVFADSARALGIYVFAGAVVGLFLPTFYLLEGTLAGDAVGLAAAAPHMFLLACQVLLEGLTFARGFSLPVRAFVPVFYNSRRLAAIVEWLRVEFGGAESSRSAGRLFAGRALAAANMAFWSFNLFGFLLPVYLPRVFKRYNNAPKEKP